MISIETLCVEIGGLTPAEVEQWIANDWVRPDREAGGYRFREIDVARVRLILELREQLEIAEPALPTVLRLVDQVYEMRRRMRSLNAALEETLSPELRLRLMERLRGPF